MWPNIWSRHYWIYCFALILILFATFILHEYPLFIAKTRWIEKGLWKGNFNPTFRRRPQQVSLRPLYYYVECFDWQMKITNDVYFQSPRSYRTFFCLRKICHAHIISLFRAYNSNTKDIPPDYKILSQQQDYMLLYTRYWAMRTTHYHFILKNLNLLGGSYWNFFLFTPTQ